MLLSILLPSLVACNTGTDVKISNVNSPPTATIISPLNGASFEELEVVTFEAQIGDNYDEPPALSVTWSSDIDGTLTGTTPADTNGILLYTTSSLSVGNHAITLLVADTEGEQSSVSVQVEVIALPTDPTIEILHPTGNDQTIEGQNFELVAEVWDARDPLNTLLVDISSDIDGNICSARANEQGRVSCETDFSAGLHEIEFVVSNSAGFEAVAVAEDFLVVDLDDIDNDGDGFSTNDGDCNDSDEDIFPGQTEIENNADDDCNGFVDDGTDAYDDDNDGYTENQGDCNDNDSSVRPNAPELENGINDDCDQYTDEGTDSFDDDGDCYCDTAPCIGSIEPSCSNIQGGDCNDGNPDISPAALEVCGNNIDENCNNDFDEENAQGCTTYYRDSDGDGHGDAAYSECWCSPGGSTGDFDVLTTDDCYDGNFDAKPGQVNYFSVDRGDGSFDYDCDNTEWEEWTDLAVCGSVFIGPNWDDWDCMPTTYGWAYSTVPACGALGFWADDPGHCSGLVCGLDSSALTSDLNSQRTQRCN